MSAALLKYEQGVNLRDRGLADDSLTDPIATFYTQTDIPRDTAVQSSMAYMAKKQKAWSIHDSCKVQESLMGKFIFFSCQHGAFDGDKALVVESRYALDTRSGRIAWIQDPRIFRRNAVF